MASGRRAAESHSGDGFSGIGLEQIRRGLPRWRGLAKSGNQQGYQTLRAQQQRVLSSVHQVFVIGINVELFEACRGDQELMFNLDAASAAGETAQVRFVIRVSVGPRFAYEPIDVWDI